MPHQSAVSIRRNITIAFAIACTVIVAFTVTVIRFQLSAVDRGAQVEARNLAGAVAVGLPASDDRVQEFVEGLHRLDGRDIVVLDIHKRGIADADPSELGAVYAHDAGGEVAATMKDGRPRLFVERGERHVDGAEQIVVARYRDGDPHARIIGAVISNTPRSTRSC